jgi:hypothetical protein
VARPAERAAVADDGLRMQERRAARRTVSAMARTAPYVRWDRVGRVALLFVGVLLVCLYVNPLRTYVATRHEASTKRGEVAALQREHGALVRRAHELRRPGSVETEARRLGMVRRDERAYVVKGLPRE